jgi:hypothetical protein
MTMNKIHTLLGALALGISAGLAQAQTLTITGNGENFAVEYGAGHVGNIVGGGAVTLLGGGEDEQILHGDASFARRPMGIPVDPGGERELVYLPQVPTSTMMSAR